MPKAAQQIRSRRAGTCALFAGLALILLRGTAGAVPLFFDEILTWHAPSGLVGRANLPAGPALESFSLPVEPTSLYVLPNSHLLATTRQPAPASGQELYDVGADGTRRRIAVFETAEGYLSTEVLDMALDHRGRFFVAVYYDKPFQPGRYELIEVDLETGAISSRRPTIDAIGLATAPRGLWALRIFDHRVVALDPDDPLTIGPSAADLSGVGPVRDLDSDSAGKLYFHIECSAPCYELAVLDIDLGLALPAPAVLYETGGVPFAGLAIRRRCSDTPTSRCLQGGRFRAEVSWRDFAGAAGQAKAAPARSRDTAVFSFFDAANWELMVKVLDGCDQNGHFWVYSSASTDVELTLTVTDTKTEAVKSYPNQLGQVARSVTDSLAFPCAP